MSDFMDVTCGVTGMAELKDEQVQPVIAKVKEQTETAIQKGYKIFWLAVVGKCQPALCHRHIGRYCRARRNYL